MKISHIQIQNFRNFKQLDVKLSDHAVIVGENKIGKSNLLFAIRILLDPSLPDTARQLKREDFWDGLDAPGKDDQIVISVDLTDFEDNVDQMAVLAEHLVEIEPMTARLTYVFQPFPDLEDPPSKDTDYHFILYGGDRPGNLIGYEVRSRIPLDILPALRDAERDLSRWTRSPLKPLLDYTAGNIDNDELLSLAAKVTESVEGLSSLEEIKKLSVSVNNKIKSMVGETHGIETGFGFSPTDPNRLIRSLRLFIDCGKRGIEDASLGTANILYLGLKTLNLELQVDEGERDHTFLGLEEPEAHLHPHLQRLVYRSYLGSRVGSERISNATPNTTLLLTTHSPHIVSVSPIHTLVLLKRSLDGKSTIASSMAQSDLDSKDIDDLERYLDITRGEIVFAKGVILVEGDAEEFLIPVLAKKIGYNLDEIGISVCSVRGINFAPYIKFLGKNGLDIPFAIITDYDPMEDESSLGENRVINHILPEILSKPEWDKMNEEELLQKSKDCGVFLNDYTLEIDMFRLWPKTMKKSMIDISDNGAARQRIKGWAENIETLNSKQLLKDISQVGKGRFAQRLASRITNVNRKECPMYIKEAIEYVYNIIK